MPETAELGQSIESQPLALSVKFTIWAPLSNLYRRSMLPIPCSTSWLSRPLHLSHGEEVCPGCGL